MKDASYLIGIYISIINHTTDNMKRAFGINEQPTMEDFEYFIEDRCFPRTRDHMKEILRDLGLTCYEPLEIIMFTEGRMAGNPMSLRIVGGMIMNAFLIF